MTPWMPPPPQASQAAPPDPRTRIQRIVGLAADLTDHPWAATLLRNDSGGVWSSLARRGLTAVEALSSCDAQVPGEVDHDIATWLALRVLSPYLPTEGFDA